MSIVAPTDAPPPPLLAEDRVKVMSRLVNNEKVLRLLYEATHH